MITSEQHYYMIKRAQLSFEIISTKSLIFI